MMVLLHVQEANKDGKKEDYEAKKNVMVVVGVEEEEGGDEEGRWWDWVLVEEKK